MTPTSEMRAAAEKARAEGLEICWDELNEADRQFYRLVTPTNVLALLDEVEALRARSDEMERENARLVEDVEIHRAARARNFDLYQAAEASRDALAAEVERLRAEIDAERDWLRQQVFALAEDTAEKYAEIGQRDVEGKQGAYARGRCVEAKSIARAIGDVCHSRKMDRALTPAAEKVDG